MDLFRVHAFAVDPTRTTELRTAPEGGRIDITPALENALASIYETARFDRRAVVDFDLDPDSGTNEVRDAVMQYAFGEDQAVDDAAADMALMLSEAMDLRSKPNLFALTALREGDQRRVVLWMFPRDSAFQFDLDNGTADLEVLSDIFSQTSRLRKAARFEGGHTPSEFIRGRVLDFQTSYEALDIADFWMFHFLQCKFGLVGEAGSRLLADAFRDAMDEAKTMGDKEKLFAAIMAVKDASKDRWSIAEIADTFLPEHLREAFLDFIPNQENRTSRFELDKEVLDSVLKFRIFSLDTGVFVSSPLDEVGESVQVEGEDQRLLVCKGRMVDQKVRRRPG